MMVDVHSHYDFGVGLVGFVGANFSSPSVSENDKVKLNLAIYHNQL